MPNALAVSLAASEVRTTSGEGSVVDVGSRTVGEVVLSVTAASGTGARLEVEVQTSDSATEGWRTVGSDVVVGAWTTKREITAAELSRYVRLIWTITGTTPSFTFSSSGVAHSVYAKPKDLGLPKEVLDSVEEAKVWREILVASTDADAYLAERYELPLVSWDGILSRNVGFIAAFRLMCTEIGFNPNGVDGFFEKNFDNALKWLKMVSCFQITPSGMVDSSTTVTTKRWAIASGGRREV